MSVKQEILYKSVKFMFARVWIELFFFLDDSRKRANIEMTDNPVSSLIFFARFQFIVKKTIIGLQSLYIKWKLI